MNTIKPSSADTPVRLKWKVSTFTDASSGEDEESFHGGTCVEVASIESGEACGGIVLRDSSDRSGPVLFFSETEWHAFTKKILDGDFKSDV